MIQATPTFNHFFIFFGSVSLNVDLHAKFEVCIFSRSRDIRGSQNLKSRLRDLGHAPFWPILSFWISTLWSPFELQISTWLDLLFRRYGRYKILAFCPENAYSGLFLAVLGDFDPKNCDIVVLTQKECNSPETRILIYNSSKLVQRFDPQVR